MAVIHFTDSKIAIATGATWGTAVEASGTALLHVDQITLSNDFATEKQPGATGRVHGLIYGAQSVDVTITSRLQYHGLNQKFLAAALGTSTAGAIATDLYTHVYDFNTTNSGTFFTLAWKVETDQVIEIPSFKVVSCEITGGPNQVPVMTVNGIGDTVVASTLTTPTNTAAEIDALTETTYHEFAVHNGANDYFVMNDYSAGAVSSPTDDIEITSWTYGITRPLERYYGAAAAGTDNTLEPYQTDVAVQTFSIDINRLDDSLYDPVDDYTNQTPKKASLLIEGPNATITTDKPSFNIQMPYLVPRAIRGYDLSRDSRIAAGIDFEPCYTGTQPTGMSENNTMIAIVNYHNLDMLA